MVRRRESIYFFLFRLVAYVAVGFLVLVVLLLVKLGADALSLTFLTKPWSHRDIASGGIIQAIAGSFYLGLGIVVVGVPLGVATAIYLVEYSRENVWKRIIELAIQNLASVPSVVYGLFGFAVFVNLLRFGSSLLSAALVLSIMVMPWVITAAVEALKSVPRRWRESSLALGASRWSTIRRVVLPAAMPGIITGSIIGLSRALGETAPIIIVGATFYMGGFPTSIFDQFMTLPYHTFILATQHADPKASSYAAATAVVLIGLTFCMSVGAMVLRTLYRRRREW